MSDSPLNETPSTSHNIELNQLHILLIETHQTTRISIKNQLYKMGIRDISQAQSYDEAKKVINRQEFELSAIVCDWDLGNTTGLELLKELRGGERYRSIPFLLMAATKVKSDIIRAIQAGVSGVMLKPFNGKTLQEKLHQLIYSPEKAPPFDPLPTSKS